MKIDPMLRIHGSALERDGRPSSPARLNRTATSPIRRDEGAPAPISIETASQRERASERNFGR